MKGTVHTGGYKSGVGKIMLNLLFCPLLLCSRLSAQDAMIDRFNTYRNKGDLDSARMVIDSAVNSGEGAYNGYYWYLSGYVYKDLYKDRQKDDPNSEWRDIAFESFKNSILFDTEDEYLVTNRQNIGYLAATYYNSAANELDTSSIMALKNCQVAAKNFEKFKQAKLLLDSTINLAPLVTEFEMALATAYTKLYNQEPDKYQLLRDQIANIYLDVLGYNPIHLDANYNLGILYYNQGVRIIRDAEYDMDLVKFSDLEDESILLFKKALPYMEKAYSIDGNREGTLKALVGIYWSLKEIEKFKEIKEKLERRK